MPDPSVLDSIPQDAPPTSREVLTAFLSSRDAGKWPIDIFIAARWRRCRQVYDFDRRLSEALARTPAEDVPAEAIRLPYPIQYVSADLGGQGLRAVKIEGDEVRTTWYGIAGASVGIGACLPQSKDVIRTEYPDDFKIGGGHTAHVDIITPKLVRVVIGVDDTDTKEKGATWASALKMAVNTPVGHFMEHKIIQLNPRSPTKTTNCCSTAVSFAVREDEVQKLIEYCYGFLKKESVSEDAVMTVFQGLEVPKELTSWAWRCKTVLVDRSEAVAMAEKHGVQIISITGEGGTIGAVAAIGCADLGPECAGVPEDFPDIVH